MAKLKIYVEDGIVQGMAADIDIEVTVCDFDTFDGNSSKDIPAYDEIGVWYIKQEPGGVDNYYRDEWEEELQKVIDWETKHGIE